jgi:opacity protein-like surface antigen
MQSRVTSSSEARASPRAHTILLIALLWCSASAAAYSADNTADSGQSMFAFSGFGTLGVVHSSEHAADFTSSIDKPNGAGYSHDWSPDVDSLIGAQVIAHFTPTLSAMLQVISEQTYDNTYTPHVEWANVKYELSPDASVRVGRTVLASFLVSDTRNVGYANPWVRPPVEVYSLVPIDSNDGIDASYRWHMGDLVQTFLGTYGATSSKLPPGGNADARRQWNVSDTLEYGAATLRIAYSRATLTIGGLDTLLGAFGQFGPQGAAIESRYDPYRKPVEFVGIGAMYNPRDWFVTAEWGTAQFHSVLGEHTAWYVSGGYRVLQFTPYLTYGALKSSSNTSDPGLNLSALPPYLAGPAMGLNAALNAILGSIAVQNTTSAGVRWDFVKNVDLKLQYDHTRLGAGSPGTLINLQPGFQSGGAVNIFSAAIDFLW